MENKNLQYSLSVDVVNYILNALNRNQIAGVQQAKDLLAVIELLQKPLNAEELEEVRVLLVEAGKLGLKTEATLRDEAVVAEEATLPE